MACLVQNGTTSSAHLPVHENLSKKRKLSSPNHFRNKRVQKIHDTSTSPPWTPLYPGSRLEQEAIQYIHKFYCKDCQMDQQAAERAKAAAAAIGEDEHMKVGSDGASIPQQHSQQPQQSHLPEVKEEPPSPMSPQQTTDEASLMVTLDKNKESLKRKLMMRRSLNELVDQGIYPPPKTPPAFMEQRKSLERAKIGDSLRFKISHRPDRKQLVQQHILEDTNIDPSLHERQRQLKRARLADSLNDKLSHRPGVLELVQGNIIQTDGKLTQLIKEGSLSFEKASELDASNDSTCTYDDAKSSDEAFSPDQTDDSNLSDISSPPAIPRAPELPTSFARSLPFSAQIQFHQDSKVTLPLTTQSFTIPNQTSLAGGLAASTSFVSPRINSNVTVSTISNNNNNKTRPKKQKPKPQPKAKVIKFHEYKGPPNVVKSSQPVSSSTMAAVNNMGNTKTILGNIQQPTAHSDTSYHILLQQQQLFLQWQLEYSQKNPNATTVLVPAQKSEGLTGFQAIASSIGSSVVSSATESAAVAITTQASPQTVFAVTPTSQQTNAQQLQQIQISSPVISQIGQEPQLGQPQPQVNAGVNSVTPKPQVKRPTVNVTPKKYTSLEEMKVAELKAELKKRNLAVSGPKPQLIERLKPYADAILKCPMDKSPSSAASVLSPTGSLLSSGSVTSPQANSEMSPTNTVTSPQTSVMSSKTVLISSPGSLLASSGAATSVTVPVMVTSFTGAFSQPESVQMNVGGLKSPGSVSSTTSSVTSPLVSSNPQSGSLFSRPGSVMSPLGSVIDETLCNTADSPLPSIQSMQSAVSVSNMAMMPDDLSNPFSPPSSPLFMENVSTPLSPDLMDMSVQSPSDPRAVKPNTNCHGVNSNGNKTQQQLTPSAIQNHMDYSNPPSVLSVAPTEADKHDTTMDIDLDLSQSLSCGLAPTIAAASGDTQLPPPPPPLPAFSCMATVGQLDSAIKTEQDDPQVLLDQIQAQLKILQEKQRQNQQQQLQQPSSSSSYQVSQEELLKKQQEKIQKLQSELEESQLQLKLQQEKLQQLQQQALQQQNAVPNQQQNQQLQHSLQQQVQQQPDKQSASAAAQHQSAQAHFMTQPQQHMPLQSQQVTIPTHSASIALQGQPKVSLQHQIQKQVGIHSHQRVQLQGQPQTVAQAQQQLPCQIPCSSPVLVQAAASVAQPSVLQAQQKSPQQSVNQKPVNTSAQVIFSVPTIPNGGKPPTLATLPPNMKQIQIPAHLLQAFQNSQLPTVIVTQNPRAAAAKKSKAPNLELIKNQSINQTLNLGPGRSMIAVSTGGTQQYLIAASPNVSRTGMSVPQSSAVTPLTTLNGLVQPPAQKLTASLPTSPVEGTQRPVSRTASNPFFIPLKEPPKYDEVVKNKPSKGPDSSSESVDKSQTMDDVLEILIRTGELPASAAQEPPPTPKTTSQSPTVPTLSVSQSAGMLLPTTQFQNHSIVFSTPQNVPSLQHVNDMQYTDKKINMDNVYMPMESMISTCVMSCDIKSEVKLEQCATQTSGMVIGPQDNSENSNDFFDLSEMINSDLNAMDWTPDPAFSDMDLADMTNTSTAMDLMPGDQSLLSIPNVQSPQRSFHGSEPDLPNLGLADMDTNSNMQIDVPDWLDVIMPNTGLTPRSANAPVSFPADPILTPQTQKEVLDLFNFDESDLNTPSDFSSMSSWDKMTEATTH